MKQAKLYSRTGQEPRIYTPEMIRDSGWDKVPSRPLPSVTTILNVVSRPAFVPAALKAMGDFLLKAEGSPITEAAVELAKKAWGQRSKEAMAIGTAIHQLCEDHALGKLPNLTGMDERIVNGYGAYMKWTNHTGFIATEVEVVLADPTEGYAGTADAVGIMRDGTRVLTDWKSGKGRDIYESHLLQWHAYAACLGIQEGYVVKFDILTGDCHPYHVKFNPRLYEGFLAARTLYEIQNEMKEDAR